MQPARSATIKTMIGLAALTPSTSTFAASVSDAAQRGVGLVLVFAIVVVAAAVIGVVRGIWRAQQSRPNNENNVKEPRIVGAAHPLPNSAPSPISRTTPPVEWLVEGVLTLREAHARVSAAHDDQTAKLKGAQAELTRIQREYATALRGLKEAKEQQLATAALLKKEQEGHAATRQQLATVAVGTDNAQKNVLGLPDERDNMVAALLEERDRIAAALEQTKLARDNALGLARQYREQAKLSDIRAEKSHAADQERREAEEVTREKLVRSVAPLTARVAAQEKHIAAQRDELTSQRETIRALRRMVADRQPEQIPDVNELRHDPAGDTRKVIFHEGDRILHARHVDWGTGYVLETVYEGERGLRATFPNVGERTLRVEAVRPIITLPAAVKRGSDKTTAPSDGPRDVTASQPPKSPKSLRCFECQETAPGMFRQLEVAGTQWVCHHCGTVVMRRRKVLLRETSLPNSDLFETAR